MAAEYLPAHSHLRLYSVHVNTLHLKIGPFGSTWTTTTTSTTRPSLDTNDNATAVPERDPHTVDVPSPRVPIGPGIGPAPTLTPGNAVALRQLRTWGLIHGGSAIPEGDSGIAAALAARETSPEMRVQQEPAAALAALAQRKAATEPPAKQSSTATVSSYTTTPRSRKAKPRSRHSVRYCANHNTGTTSQGAWLIMLMALGPRRPQPAWGSRTSSVEESQPALPATRSRPAREPGTFAENPRTLWIPHGLAQRINEGSGLESRDRAASALESDQQTSRRITGTTNAAPPQLIRGPPTPSGGEPRPVVYATPPMDPHLFSPS